MVVNYGKKEIDVRSVQITEKHLLGFHLTLFNMNSTQKLLFDDTYVLSHFCLHRDILNVIMIIEILYELLRFCYG